MAHKIKKAKGKIVFHNILSLISIVFGIMITMLFGGILFDFLFDKTSDIGSIVILIMIVSLSLAMIVWGYKTKVLINLFKKYVYIISSTNDGSLSNLAASLGKSENTVLKNLQKMIDRLYFPNAHIDHRKKEIMIAGKSLDKLKLSNAEMSKCRNCGAYGINVREDDNYCEYCGTLLK